MIVEVSGNGLLKRLISLPQIPPFEKILYLQEAGVKEIICGAITCGAEIFAGSIGMTVHSFKSGDIDEIIKVWLDQELENPVHSMPGCRRRRHRINSEDFLTDCPGPMRRGHAAGPDDLPRGMGGGSRRGRGNRGRW